jgi:hypothetical protein
MLVKVKSFCVLMMLIASTSVVEAQQRRGFSSGRTDVLRVAAVAEVAKELKLSEEHTALAKKLNEENRKQRTELFSNFGDLSQEERREKSQQYNQQREEKEKQFAKSVGEEKYKRLTQLSLQSGGLLGAVFSSELREKLKVTDEQRNQAREGLTGMREEFTAARNDAAARTKLLKKVDEKVREILTDEQKEQWKKMLGKPASEELLAKIRAATTRRRRSTN